jgi:hypothetical protein
MQALHDGDLQRRLHDGLEGLFAFGELDGHGIDLFFGMAPV